MKWEKYISIYEVEVPWYEAKGQIKRSDRVKDFRVLRDKDGIPLDIGPNGLPKLIVGLRAACEAVGARLVERGGKPAPLHFCEGCDVIFHAKTKRARYCEECLATRASHKGRKEIYPDYADKNRERVRKSRQKKKDQEERWKELSKAPLNRRKKTNAN